MRLRLNWLAGIALVVSACSASNDAVTTVVTSPPTSLLETTTTTLPAGVTAILDLDHRPSGILVVDDVIWTEDHAQNQRVYVVDPETGGTLAIVAVSRPCDLAATEGRVWVADLNLGKLVWIDTTTRAPGGEVAGVAGPCGLQVVDGALWFVVDTGLARMDLATEAVTVTELGGAAFPGAGNPLWAAMYDSGDLLRVDTATGEVELTIAHPGGNVEGPPVGAGFDSIWVGGPSDTVYRLDPITGEVQAEIAATQATRLLVTSSGVWLTSYGPGVVARIDPATNQVVFEARLGGNLNGIAEGLDSIWVADTARGLIYRIDPAAVGLDP